MGRSTVAGHGDCPNNSLRNLWLRISESPDPLRTTLAQCQKYTVLFAAMVCSGVLAANAKDIAVAEPTYSIFVHGGEVVSPDCCIISSSSSSGPYWLIGGAFTTPIGDGLGFQMDVIDIVGGQMHDEGLAASLRLFTRNPESHLFGVFLSSNFQEVGHEHVLRLGLETELYIDDLTVVAQAGYRYDDHALFSETPRGTARPFFALGLRWYLEEDLAVSGAIASYRGDDDYPFGTVVFQERLHRLTLEWMPLKDIWSGFAVRVDWTDADDGHETLLGGIVYHFGSSFDLKTRDREYITPRDLPPLSP